MVTALPGRVALLRTSRLSVMFNMNDYKFDFYESNTYGLIRVRHNDDEYCYPEIVVNGHWVKGNEYVMDAVIGMGEDAYSSGEMAFQIENEKAELKANELGINLYSEPHD